MMEGGTEAWVSGLRLVRFRRNSHSSTERPACKGRGGGKAVGWRPWRLCGGVGVGCVVWWAIEVGRGRVGEEWLSPSRADCILGTRDQDHLFVGMAGGGKPLGVDWVLWTGHCTLCTTKVGLMKA